MTGMIEVARSSVQTWQCDQMGHMNVQFYLDQAEQGIAALALALGLPPGEALRLRAREHHVRFLREQRPGAPFFLRAGVVDVGEGGLTVYEELVETVSGTPAATFRVELACEDATTTPRPLPATARQAASALHAEVPEHGRARPRPRPASPVAAP